MSVSTTVATANDERDGGLSESCSSSNDDQEPPRKKSRKRTKHPELWKKTKRKQRRNSGKRYTSASGIVVSVEM